MASGVRHLHELEPLCLQASDLALCPGNDRGCLVLASYERLQLRADVLGPEGVEVYPQVPALLDPPLDVGSREVRKIAAGVLMPLAAHVVIERVTALALAGRVEEAAPAPRAGQKPTQVVGVAAVLDRVPIALLQHLLHPVEQRLLDEGRMLAGVLNAPVRDTAEVVAVAQDLGEFREGHRLGRLRRGRPGEHALGGQLLMQPLERGLARCVQRERAARSGRVLGRSPPCARHDRRPGCGR